MKILVLAPHPFYQERGTPIAVGLLVRVLCDDGNRVDLLTYPEGSDRVFPNLRIIRIPKIPGLSNIRPGISFKKIVYDVVFFFWMWGLVIGNRYDVVHAVEESSFMAMLVRMFTRTPYIADMDSIMSAQIVDRFPSLKPAGSALRWVESLPLRYADLIVPMCDQFRDVVRRYRSEKDIIVLRDVTLVQKDSNAAAVVSLREEFGVQGYMLMYIGNLEQYQGIDLLLSSFKLARNRAEDISLVIIGGRDDDLEKYRSMARDLGVHDATHFLGPRPVNEIGNYMEQADVLVSPRTHGVNTPMKIYSYLDSGVPVLATNLSTHTQVLSDDIALLVEPSPRPFADGILRLKDDPALGCDMAGNARSYVMQEHSFEKFRETVGLIYDEISTRRARRDKH